VLEGDHSVISSTEGGSKYFVLPMKWAKAHNIKRKTKLHFLANGVLVIIPPDEMENFKKHKEEMV